MNRQLIAPCGINCTVCACYLALKNDVKSKGVKIPYCAGCRIRDKKCAFLKKRCKLLLSGKVEYCFECKDFPCRRLEAIDQRYRQRYRMSIVENLKFIKQNGIDKFLKKEKKKWQCPKCKSMISCHNGLCFTCDLDKLKRKRKKYRWGDE